MTFPRFVIVDGRPRYSRPAFHQNEEMRLPTAEELEERGHKDFDEAHSVEEWHRLLERKRGRLVRFLRTAVGLEEDLVRGFI